MGFSAVIGLAAVSTYTAAQNQKKAIEEQTRAAEQGNQAAIEQAQRDTEAANQRAIAQQAAESQRTADATAGAQNSKVSELTPTIQLAANGQGEASGAKARNRRAQFRPEYTSGVSI